MDPIALIGSLINAVEALINEVKNLGIALKNVSDPSIAEDPLQFPAGAVQRAKYIGNVAGGLISSMEALYAVVAGIIP